MPPRFVLIAKRFQAAILDEMVDGTQFDISRVLNKPQIAAIMVI